MADREDISLLEINLVSLFEPISSYLGRDKMSDDRALDLKLISEYDGTGSVVEWLDKTELVCKIRKIDDLALVIPLRLTKGAFAVYQQLSDTEKQSADSIKSALKAAFAVDAFSAYEQFVSRRLLPGESCDVFLAELRRLGQLFGGVSDKTLCCAFVAGLPDNVRHILRAGARLDSMTIQKVLIRARAVMTDENSGVVAAGFSRGARESRFSARESRNTVKKCHICSSTEHFMNRCPERSNSNSQNPSGRTIRCWRCQKLGHTSPNCTENLNSIGEEAKAPGSSSTQ